MKCINIYVCRTYENLHYAYKYIGIRKQEIGSGTKLFITFLSLKFFDTRRETQFPSMLAFPSAPTTCGAFRRPQLVLPRRGPKINLPRLSSKLN